MSSFSALHNTVLWTADGTAELSTCGILRYLYSTDYRLTAPSRYLCDCDPLGAFSRQRWAQVANESRGMSPSSQIKHSNFQTLAWKIYSFGLTAMMMMRAIRNLSL